MKLSRIILLICFIAGFGQFSFAQATDSIPVYKQFPVVPPFKIMRYPDSTAFAKKDLSEKRPVMIIVFSPDCHHCQLATKDLVENIELFKKVQVVMATPLDYKYLAPFYKDYNLAQYPNITIGRDGSYFLGTYYNVKSYPSIYLYDKKGKFVEEFVGDVSFKKIAAFL